MGPYHHCFLPVLDQRNITGCALRAENWVWLQRLHRSSYNSDFVSLQFDKNGNYRFEKAETEIKNKKLSNEMQTQLVNAHQLCGKDAKDKFVAMRVDVVDQVQLYQACVSR